MHHFKARTVVWLASLLVVVGLCLAGTTGPAAADPGNSGDDSCTTGSFSGNSTDGSWTRTYRPQCGSSTTADVDISWSNYTSSGIHHLVWDATLTVGAISGDDCVQIALDWNNIGQNHSDVQIMRNCDEFSTRTMSSQDVNFGDLGGTGTNWPVLRLQMSSFDRDTLDVYSVVCPSASGSPTGSNTDALCTDWNKNGSAFWGSTAAKIYRRMDDHVNENNDPTYPAHYTLAEQVDPHN
jgi:hypothetical protein